MPVTNPNTAEAEIALPDWKAQFLAHLSHEVRTPLSGITGMADLLLETTLTAEQRDYVLTVRACAEDLLAILDQALDLTDLSLSPTAIPQQQFQLVETVLGALSQQPAAAEVSEEGARLQVEVEKGLPEVVLGDAVSLRKLLTEMALCSLRASRGGHVFFDVSGRRDGNIFHLTLECRATPDGGPISSDPQAVATAGRTAVNGARGRNGLRLGWALVYELTRCLGGTMWFVSEGDGACFCRVMVPLALSDASGWGVEPVPAPAVPKAILLVEDNEIARRVVRYILSRQQDKYTVDCAPDGKEALEKAARRRYDLILMDLQLPEMDGFEAACRLRSLPGYADVPVLALTANVTPDYRELCLRNGMAGFIPKPVQAAELLAAVAQALAG